MDFYDVIAEKGLLNILKHEEYCTPFFHGWERVKSFLLDIVQNNRSVFAEGDYDVDGLYSILTIVKGLKDLGVTDIGMYNYRSRTHSVDRVAIQQCIQGHYDYFIVTDAGSNDLGLFKILETYGIRVIILDHHVTELTYNDFGDNIAIINTELENALGGEFELSAGALCFIVMDLLYKELGREIPQSFAAFATVTLFSDMMNMHNALNRAIYYLAVEQPEDELPEEVLYFKNQYSKFNARYVGYWLSPRINACFRAERFNVLNKLFFNECSSTEKADYIQFIEQIYVDSRNMIAMLSDVIGNYCVELDHFVYADLNSLDKYLNIQENKLQNYTGLLANSLATKFGKTGVVTCLDKDGYKGSVRDQNGCDYLQIFRQLCYAGGHPSAFGFKVNPLDINRFMEDFYNVDKNYAITGVNNAPIVIDVPNAAPPDEGLVQDIAKYNEFSGTGVPIVLLQKKMIGDVRERKTNYDYRYRWGVYEINSSAKVQFGKTVLIKPYYAGKLKLTVQS